jgi:PAS domain S-box-containing protein
VVSAQVLEGPGGLLLDLNRRTATVNGVTVNLKRREVDLLVVLLTERGRVVPFEELARRAWGTELGGDARFIYTTAWRLRRALESAGAPDVLESVRGVGYFVRESDEEAAQLRGAAPRVRDPDTRALALFDPADPDLRIAMVNELAAEISGYDADTLTHLPEAAIKLWSAEEREFIDDAVRDAMVSGSSVTSGRRLQRADGTEVMVNVHFRRLEQPGLAPYMLAEVELVGPA